MAIIELSRNKLKPPRAIHPTTLPLSVGHEAASSVINWFQRSNHVLNMFFSLESRFNLPTKSLVPSIRNDFEHDTTGRREELPIYSRGMLSVVSMTVLDS